MSPSLPSPIDLVQKTLEALFANPLGYWLSGLAVTLVGVALAIGLGIGWAGMAVLVFPALAATESSAMGAVAMLLAVVAGLASLVVAVVIPAPIQASLLRAFDVEGPASIGFGAAFSRMQGDAVRIMVATLGVVGLALLGTLLCVLPGLLVAYAMHLVLPAVALDGLSPVDAARRSWEHVTTRPGWSLGVFAVLALAVSIISQIPILGLVAVPLGMDYLVRAYRAAYPA